jgi:hypothetical protein
MSGWMDGLRMHKLMCLTSFRPVFAQRVVGKAGKAAAPGPAASMESSEADLGV